MKIQSLLIILALCAGNLYSMQIINDLTWNALNNKNIVQVRELIKNGADVNHAPDFSSGIALLHQAILMKCPYMTKCLIDNGADIEQKTDDGLTPLFIAVMLNQDPIIKMLLKAGASANNADNNGNTMLGVTAKKVFNTALQHKIQANNNLVSLLTNNGADAQPAIRGLKNPENIQSGETKEQIMQAITIIKKTFIDRTVSINRRLRKTETQGTEQFFILPLEIQEKITEYCN